jgi:hypothetical protein
MPRYGLTTPTITSQIFGFSTMTIYQYVVLTPVSRFSKVNLNFALCHTPADPGFDMFGYHYFFYGFMYLGCVELHDEADPLPGQMDCNGSNK